MKPRSPPSGLRSIRSVGTEVVYRISNASQPILSHPVTALSQCRKVQNLPEHCSQNAVLSVVVGSVLITAVVAVLVTAAEAFSEVVVVRTLVFAIAVIPVVRVLVGIGIAVVEVPAIFTVRDTSAIAFSIAVVHRPPQQVRTVLVDLVVRPTAVIAINRWRVEVRVGVVVISGLPDANLLLPQVFQIFSLEAVLRQTPLALQLLRLPLQTPLLLLEVSTILSHAYLLSLDELRLPLLGKPLLLHLLLPVPFSLRLPLVHLDLRLPLLCAFLLLTAQLLLALDREALLLLFSAVQFLLRLVLRSLPILFKLPLLLFLSLHLPAVSLRLPWFLAAARLWPVLRPLGSPSILILLVSILFAVWLILLRMAGNTRRKKQTHNRSSHNSDALHVASKHLDA